MTRQQVSYNTGLHKWHDNRYPTKQAYTNDTTFTDNSYPTIQAYTNDTTTVILQYRPTQMTRLLTTGILQYRPTQMTRQQVSYNTGLHKWHDNTYPTIQAYTNDTTTGILQYRPTQMTRQQLSYNTGLHLSLIHIWRCRRGAECRSRWSPYH